jgi:predicted transcriptional regulator
MALSKPVLQSSQYLKGVIMPKPMTKAEKKAAYEAWYLAEIDKGLEDIEAGRVLTNEEATAHIEAVFAELEAKSREQRKAA